MWGWSLLEPSHPSFGSHPSHQCPFGKTVPRLGVWVFGSIGGDALRACPAMEPTAQPNGYVWASCGPAAGSPTAGPKLGTSRLNLGLLQAHPDGGPLLWRPKHPPRTHHESVPITEYVGTVWSPRVSHPIGVRWPRSEPCFGGALWSAAKRACLDLGAVSLPLKIQN